MPPLFNEKEKPNDDFTQQKIENKIFDTYELSSESNWMLAKMIWGKNKNFNLFDPSKIHNRKNVCFDALLQHKEKPIIYLIEIKRREVDEQTIKEDWNGELFLEKKKWNGLKKMKENYKKGHREKEIKILYLNKTVDGILYEFDLEKLEKNFKWEKRVMNKMTYSNNKEKIFKTVTLLNIKDAKRVQTQIMN